MIEVRICCGLSCTARGGQELLLSIEQDPVLPSLVRLRYEKCMGRCTEGEHTPVAEIDGVLYESVTPERLLDILYEKAGISAPSEVD